MKHYVKQNSGFVDAVEDGDIIYNGVKSGRVRGYLATWDEDRGRDTFHPGAFLESIAQMNQRGRDLRLKDMHDRTIGVFDRKSLREDSKGLFGTGYINLEVQQGREAHSLAKQGAYDSFSVGFSIPEGGSKGEFPLGRDIFKADLWESSIVDEPMNPEAVIVDVKNVTAFADLPLASESLDWDSTAAEKRIRTWADAEDGPNAKYKRAFLWFDPDNADTFGGYRFPIADVIEGELRAVPRAIYAAAAAIQGARAETTIPEADKDKIRAHLDRYYSKMGKDSPWGVKMLGDLLGDANEIKTMTVREIEKVFTDAGCSSNQAKTLISTLKKAQPEPENTNEPDPAVALENQKCIQDILAEIQKFGTRQNA